jgi:hypothetical protein
MPPTAQLLGALEPQAAENEVATRGVIYQAAPEAYERCYTSGRLVTIEVAMWQRMCALSQRNSGGGRNFSAIPFRNSCRND